MRIGIIGLGVVGSAIFNGLSNYTKFDVKTYDIKTHSKFDWILNTDGVFVCVPTNPTIDGRCDLSAVEATLENLAADNYSGVIILKSTILPGSTERFLSQYKHLKICFVPEFLRQDSANIDFVSKDNALIVGTYSDEIYQLVCEIHKNIVGLSKKVSPTEAELVKYFCNTFNSTRIVFANAFYEVCQKLDANYDNVLAAAKLGPVYSYGDYLRCNENLRGFGGACLPKDIQAFDKLIDDLNLPIELFKTVIKDNEQFNK